MLNNSILVFDAEEANKKTESILKKHKIPSITNLTWISTYVRINLIQVLQVTIKFFKNKLDCKTRENYSFWKIWW
jgi:hypothetical protein